MTVEPCIKAKVEIPKISLFNRVFVMKIALRFPSLVLSAFAFCLIFAVNSAAQVKPSPSPTPNTVSATSQAGDSSGVFEVRLPITVTSKDKKNPLVSGLTKADFIILEDKKPQEITFFQDEKNSPPIFVGVLMDTSPSTAGKMGFSKDAAKTFIYSVVRLRKDKVAFLTFDHAIKLRQDFSDKLDLLDRAVDGVKQTGNQTALYDSVYQFCDEKLRNAKGRRVVVIITDGEDTFSRADLSDAINIAQRTETTIFAISTKGGFLGSVPGVEGGTVKDKGDKELVKLCEETGGEAFFTGDITELEKAFTRISKELQTQYIVTYKPENQNLDGKKRQIEVRLTNKEIDGKYKIRTRKEYTAERDTIKAVSENFLPKEKVTKKKLRHTGKNQENG